MKLTIALFPILLVLSIVVACGYQIMGKGERFADGLTTLGISSLENTTQEPNLSKIFVAALRRECIFRRDLKIVRAHEAEAIVKGTIRSFTTSSLSYDAEGRVKEYRITITLDLLLAQQGDGAILWRGDGIRGSEEYQASSDVMANEGRKNRAIRKIATDLAEAVYLRMKEGF